MARIRSIKIGMGRTYNMGDYESYRIDGGLEIELDPEEDPLEAARRYYPTLREQMRETYREFKPVRKESK